jgi:hypothetical protein
MAIGFLFSSSDGRLHSYFYSSGAKMRTTYPESIPAILASISHESGRSGRLIGQLERDAFGVAIRMHYPERSPLFPEILCCDKLFRRIL